MNIFNKTTLLAVSLVTALCSVSIYSMDIFQAAETGNVARIQELITAGVNVNQPDHDGSTPLYWAAVYGRQAVVQTLIAAGATINQTDIIGLTPLQQSVNFGQQSMVALLTDYEQRIQEAQRRAPIIARTIAQATHPRLGGHEAGQNASPLALLDRFLLRDIADLVSQAEDHDARQPREVQAPQ